MDKQNINYVFVLMSINLVFKIKKPTNPPLLNIAGKMITLLIFTLLKLFAHPTLYMNLTSLKHSISTEIITMLSTVILPFLLYQIFGNLTLILISSDFSSFFQALPVSFHIMLSYRSIPWIL